VRTSVHELLDTEAFERLVISPRRRFLFAALQILTYLATIGERGVVQSRCLEGVAHLRLVVQLTVWERPVQFLHHMRHGDVVLYIVPNNLLHDA